MNRLPPDWHLHAPWIALLGSVATLGSALISQYVFGLEPCVLCIWQRWPYVAAIVLSATALAVPGPRWFRPALVALSAAAFLTTAGVGVFHVGVEQHWWEGTSECTGGPAARTIDELRAQLLGRKPARCDDIAFSFLGISMAGWNVLIGVGLAGISMIAARRLWRQRAS